MEANLYMACLAEAGLPKLDSNRLFSISPRTRVQYPTEEGMFGLLMTIIIGFVVGVIAKLIMPGKENMGFIVTTLLGIAGSLAATYIGQAVGWYAAGQGAGWIGSIVGAFVLLWIYQKMKSRNPAA
ncbi:MAG: GlsB/YeaQ/YmgE family stress response membrane protein [Candidatus Binatia bacterium]|nr:GlsB/YeaQ/YmgE family stress response membrane protein [Candidatus Binatia bacterium]